MFIYIETDDFQIYTPLSLSTISCTYSMCVMAIVIILCKDSPHRAGNNICTCYEVKSGGDINVKSSNS